MNAGLDISAADAMASPLLFGPYFRGSSRETWRSVVKAAFGQPLSSDDLVLFKSVAERDPPSHPVRELVAAVGRGGGKDSVASLLATCSAINFSSDGRLRPGEKAVVMCLACDRAQAGIVLSYLKGYFETIPALKSLVVNMGQESIELNNGVVIEVHTNSFRAVRGRTLLCVIFDEAAFWRDENFASPDIEMDSAVGPGLARMPGSIKTIISSVHKRSGLLYQQVQDHFGKNDDEILVVMGGTTVFNPSFDRGIIQRALEQDPERYGAEYLCWWRDDLATFLQRDLLDAAIDKDVVVRPPAPGIVYTAACDASGGRNDSFTAAVAHAEHDGKVVLDLAFERKSPFNPSEVVAEIVRLMKEYRCHQITGDHYGASWVTESFSKAGAKYIQANRDRSAVYMDIMPLFTSGRARLLDNQKLVLQFAALERRTFSTGRERIDPGPGHDDLANSAAIAMSLVSRGRRGVVVTPEMLQRFSQPTRYGRGPNSYSENQHGWSVPIPGTRY